MEKITLKVIHENISNMSPDTALKYLINIQSSTSIKIDKLISKINKQKEQMLIEDQRLMRMSLFEKMSYEEGYSLIAGVDEAGRGPLAGAVVAAAVILPVDVHIIGLDDSKKLSAKKRDILFDEIKQKAISYGIGIVDEKQIDSLNILNATKKAMKIAVEKLKNTPDIVLVDAETIDNIPQRQIPIIKGDEKSISIAAASIIAKVTRDRMMDDLSIIYPEYGFAKHKGYGTKDHIEAIKKFGICPIHRLSFTKNFI